ncbi:hypothetical protein [Pedobacter metabolipauper]|uniref:Uncharacterized protein n=1 Tax=Pedobacter metabolipauper TaxID=425513 RepID=A0A4R6SXF6_9SPHI|nr:hypothetical protein [Pedobacter metabolipauper]TDQ11086.1 hypothetical protein ATK78_0200 [Pedobacter metabolipauper]
MKISNNDPFDLHLCMRGLGNLITHMHSELYEYLYYFTFKKSMKAYAGEFNDAWDQGINDLDFFKEIEDPFVQNCFLAEIMLIDCKNEMVRRFGIDEIEDLNDEHILLQSERFKPYFLVYKNSKSYKKLRLFYIRALTDHIKSLHLYASAITAQSYKVPKVLRQQLDLPGEESMKFLNHEDNNVILLMELMTGLKKILEDFKVLNMPKPPRGKGNSKTTPTGSPKT